MISGIVPRPVAFVSSVSEDGVENLAPFRCVADHVRALLEANPLPYSWFNMVGLVEAALGHDPDLLHRSPTLRR